MIRVLLADDNRLVRSAVSDLLRRDPAVELVGLVSDGQEVPSAVLDLEPDVVLMDLSMPFVDGIEATRQLRASGFPGTVLMLAARSERHLLPSALDAGAAGYLLKDEDPAEFRRALPMAILSAPRMHAGVRVYPGSPKS